MKWSANNICTQRNQPKSPTSHTYEYSHLLLSGNIQHNLIGIGKINDRYKVTGIGETATASVCSNNGVVTDFAILEKCNSNARGDCNGFPNTELALCENNEFVTYSWDATNGVEYFVHVRADEVSNFTLVVSGVEEEPEPAPAPGPVGGDDSGSTIYHSSKGNTILAVIFFSTVLLFYVGLIV